MTCPNDAVDAHPGIGRWVVQLRESHYKCALLHAGLRVVALHHHMIGEEPVIYFTCFWAKEATAEFAQGFRAALDVQQAAERGR